MEQLTQQLKAERGFNAAMVEECDYEKRREICLASLASIRHEPNGTAVRYSKSVDFQSDDDCDEFDLSPLSVEESTWKLGARVDIEREEDLAPTAV